MFNDEFVLPKSCERIMMRSLKSPQPSPIRRIAPPSEFGDSHLRRRPSPRRSDPHALPTIPHNAASHVKPLITETPDLTPQDALPKHGGKRQKSQPRDVLTPVEEVSESTSHQSNKHNELGKVKGESFVVPEITVQEAPSSDELEESRKSPEHVAVDQSGVPSAVRTARSVSVCITSLEKGSGEKDTIELEGPSDATGLSFIMKERLHRLATDLHRRTSQMKDHVQRPPTPDDELLSTFGDDESRIAERRRSLNSFIGLSSPAASTLTELTPEEAAKLNEMPTWKKIFMSPLWRRRLLPTSIDRTRKRYLVWLSIVSCCFLYNAYGIPLRSSYPYQTPSNLPLWLLADYFSDLIYLFDILLIKPRLRFNKGGLTIKEPKEMKHHYLHSIYFKLDLLSLLPLDLLYFFIGPKAMLRIPRILKIMSYWDCFHLLDSRVSNPLILRIAKTLSYMVYIIHVNSCIFYSFSAWQGFGNYGYIVNGKWERNKWVYGNVGNAYIRCFYFTTKLATSIGNNPPPSNVLENIYVTFSWLMGVFVFALLLGQIRDIVATATRHREEFRKKMDMTQQHLKRLKIPHELQNRVRDWFIYTWQQQKTLDEMQLIDKLPLKLQTDLALSVHYDTLSKVQLFQDCDKALLRDLVLKLKPVLFLPGDFVCKKGEVGKEMYIVNKGLVDVVGGPKGDTVFATLKEGSVFGEISLLALAGGNKRTADVKSRGFSNLFVLSKDDLNEIIKDYPDAQRILNNKAKKMLKKTEEREGKREPEDLQKIATVSSGINTPKMIDTVFQLLDPKSKVASELKSILEADSDDEGSEMSSVIGDYLGLDPLKIHEAIDKSRQQGGTVPMESLKVEKVSSQRRKKEE